MTVPGPAPDRDLSSAQVSYRTGLSVETLRQWRNAHKGPPTFKIGRRYYYRESELIAWQNANHAGANAAGNGAPLTPGT